MADTLGALDNALPRIAVDMLDARVGEEVTGRRLVSAHSSLPLSG